MVGPNHLTKRIVPDPVPSSHNASMTFLSVLPVRPGPGHHVLPALTCERELRRCSERSFRSAHRTDQRVLDRSSDPVGHHKALSTGEG